LSDQGAICSRLRFRVEVLGEKLRGEKHFIDKPARRVPINVTGNDQRPGGRRDQNAVDAVGELEMRCVRLKAWLTAKLHRLGEVDMCEVTLGQVDMVNQAPWDTSSYQVATQLAQQRS
jgi:hypothetical protein